jgi:ribosome-binding protein aMBF1 (putative translation factor)
MSEQHPLATARIKLGLSQAACAQLVGCKRWMINRIEANERRPSPQLASKIEDVTGVDVRVLLGLPQKDEAA